MDEFNKLLNLNTFSHAYLIESTNLEEAYPNVLKLVKKILCKNNNYKEECSDCNICHLIDNNLYDDYLIINPETTTIKSEELTNLFNKFKDTSINENKNRVYLIYGFERIDKGISNKILKFLEEPEDNIYGILLTTNLNKIINTIKSRCQIIKIKGKPKEYDSKKVRVVKDFLDTLIIEKEKTICYYSKLFEETFVERKDYKEFFEILEEQLSIMLTNKFNDINQNNDLTQENLINLIKIVDNLQKLIDNNINLQLLIDRLIIEFSKEV